MRLEHWAGTPAAQPCQLGLLLDAESANPGPQPALPGLQLTDWLWRLPPAICNDSLRAWLGQWSQYRLQHSPRWVTIAGMDYLPHTLLKQLRDSGLPALLLRPQPGTPLELLAEHALQAGKSDIVIAPMPPANSNWLERYHHAAVQGRTHAILV